MSTIISSKILYRACSFILVALLAAGNAKAQTWLPPVEVASKWIGAGGNIGQFNDSKLVNGHPAMVFFDDENYDLVYARMIDSAGTAWSKPVIVDNGAYTGHYPSIQVVNGHPAIAYYDMASADLKYVRANDLNGTSWPTPITVASAGMVGAHASLCIINGNPAISYYDETNRQLKYVRATDNNGINWGTPVNLTAASSNEGQFSGMKDVNGRPAVIYTLPTGSLQFLRAADANGVSWLAPVTIAPLAGHFRRGFEIIDGYPAVAYTTAGVLNYSRSTNADGTAWGAAVAIPTASSISQQTSLQVVQGNPAISFYHNGSLGYVRASNSTGSTWNTYLRPDPLVNTGQYSILLVAQGKPVISYLNLKVNSDLKYIRAIDATGTAWGTPIVLDAGNNSFGFDSQVRKVNGRPAICFSNGEGNIMYCRSLDSLGLAWPVPTVITTGSQFSFNIVNGKPALCFINAGLNFMQASDMDGNNWNASVAIGIPSNSSFPCLEMINGVPAISYRFLNRDFFGYDLAYVRANDPDGISWGTSVYPDRDGIVGIFSSLKLVDGRPAISYFDETNRKLKYVRALNEIGSAWGTPMVLDDGIGSSLEIVNGRPAIAYKTYTDNKLRYIAANDVTGSSWATAIEIDPQTTGIALAPTLKIIDSRPAISYTDYNGRQLKFVRAADVAGTNWPTPVVIATGAVSQSMINSGQGAGISYLNRNEYSLNYISTNNFFVVPVQLMQATAYKNNNGVLVQWEVAQETGILSYDIERSVNGLQFAVAGNVTASGSGTVAKTYQYFDAMATTGVNYYRIKINDNAAQTKYSHIMRVNLATTQKDQLIIYPNPVIGNRLDFQLNLPPGNYDMVISNSLGVQLSSSRVLQISNSSAQSIALPVNLPAGMYYARILNGSVTVVQQFRKN